GRRRSRAPPPCGRCRPSAAARERGGRRAPSRAFNTPRNDAVNFPLRRAGQLRKTGAVETRRPTNPAAEEILGLYFPVLDHGFVALVDYMGSDEDVERAARVSYGYGTRRTSETRGLIRYLRRHRHTTPSEMVELKVHCAMPIFVARQWVRHRAVSLNEYSG